MKRITCALVLLVFASTCLELWAMLAILSAGRNAGRMLPSFLNLCITLRPALVALPLIAMVYYLWLSLQKEEKDSRWLWFIAVTMTVLIVFVLPLISRTWLLLVGLGNAGVGVS